MKKYFIRLSLLFLSINILFAQQVDVFSRPKQVERSREYDVIHYKIKLKFDENKKAFYGQNTITLSPFKDDFTTCVLDTETFTVTSVKDEESDPLEFRQTDHQLIVHLKKAYDFEEILSLTVFYLAENITIEKGKPGEKKHYPLGISFVDESPHNPRLIQALSFPTGARHWFPCYDHPNDKATQEVIVTVKNDYKALSNGKLISVTEDKENKTKTYHWHQKLPHPTYLSMLVAGPYIILEDSLGSLSIDYWVYPKDVENARRSFHKTPEIIELFNKEYGYEYPWAKCDQITIPGIGGGAECTSATLLGHSTIHDEKAEKDFPSHWLVAHEAAHQWWGDLITLRDWSHTWINESFGTYAEVIFALHDKGEDEAAINILEKKNIYLREAHSRYMRPIVFDRWETPEQNFDRHTYQKGAAVIHMLKWILGEKPFHKTISHFLHKHAFQPVDTHDFLTSIKEATGQNLDWFFEQWLFKPGHPVFDVNYTWDSKTKRLKIKIDQTQDISKEVPIFRMPVILGIVTSEGKNSAKVWLEKKSEIFELRCSHKPLMIRFDEGNYLLKEWTFTKSLDELVYQLKNDDVIGRMWAASELLKFKDHPMAISNLIECAKNEKFWAVRKEAVETLGRIQEKDHIDFFKEKCKDKNSKVRTAAVKALGDYRDTKLIEFFKERFEKEDSYLAQAESLRSIGKCGDEALIPLLKKAMNMNAPRNIIKTSAKWAIEQINKK